ncbi:hypothetical protein PMI28_03371 [Pseudomonas sp. GM48]|jgi:hypothetical protein|nr:hypothetical protein PMI28_03371 [Pseudomonas sp. GM48]
MIANDSNRDGVRCVNSAVLPTLLNGDGLGPKVVVKP